MPPKILVIADWYLPGYKAGGQVTAVANLVESVGDSFDVFVFTRDRDLTDAKPYAGVRRDEWVSVGKARAVYTPNLSLRHLRRRILEIRPEIIYLNSFFSILAIRTLLLRRLGFLHGCAVVLAPRGEFSPGALRIKAWRKSGFTKCASRAGLYRAVIWQASSELERGQIATRLSTARIKHPCIHLAADLPSQEWLEATKRPAKPVKGRGARFLFVSRISRMKNLLFALDLFIWLRGNVEFDIFGPVDDRSYWQECGKKIKSLPGNVTVRYQGMVARELVPKVAAGYHFFLLPTLGENFGYVILEAMAAGCPAIISNRTPWEDASKQEAGWSLSLEDRELWRSVLQRCVDMDQEEYSKMSSRAREFVEAWATSGNRRDESIQLFNLAMDGNKSRNFSTLGAAPSGLRREKGETDC